jgi:iron complex outermembrane receptor protein
MKLLATALSRAPAPRARRLPVHICATGVLVLLASAAAGAADTVPADPGSLEEVIVTARKTEENIQDTPVAVTALTAAALEERAITNISEIASSTPSLRFDPVAAISGSSNSVTVFMRGVGQTDFNLTIDPGVGIYVDGVYISRSVGALLDTADIDRIEVLRGPQGTLFGKNTIGGAIAITSLRPATELGFTAELAAGSFDRADVRFTADVPLSDEWRLHFTGARFTRDGYVERLYDGEDASDRDALMGRLVTEWTPGDATLTLALDGSRSREATVGATALKIYEVNPSPATIPVHFPTISNLLLNGASCVPPNPGRLSDPVCYNEQWLSGDPRKTWAAGSNVSDADVWGASLTAEFPLGSLRFKSITAYRELDSDFDLDTDVSPVALVNTANDYQQEQFSQEFQLSGESGERLRWLLGLYYLGERGTDVNLLTTVLTTFRSGGSVDNDSYAAFGQLIWDVAPRTALTLGGRYTSETKRFSPDQVILTTLPVPGLPFAPGDRVLPLGEVATESDEFTPSVSLDYEFADTVMAYVSYARGFKSGGFTQRIFPPEPETPSFEPEFVDTYETGLKTELLDRRLRWNSAVFYSEYTDQQVIVIDGFAPKVRNAGDSRIWGVESEIEAIASPRLRLNGSVSYLNAEYTSIDPRAAPVNIDSMLVNTPEWMVSLGLTGVLWANGSGELSTRWDWSYSSELAKDSENTPELIQEAYDTVNASVTYARADGRWALTVGGTNLTDEDYLVSGNYNPAIGAVYGIYNRPREWYARLKLNF